MKVFVVNLDVDHERLAAVDAQLGRLAVKYARVSAVYGKSLSAAEKAAVVDRFRWWCAVGRQVMDGEIGCALSHQRIYRQMVEEKVPVACVLEDDVVLSDKFPKVIAWLEKCLNPELPQVALLSNHTGASFSDVANGKYFLDDSRMDLFTEGYVITGAAARNLLAVNYPIQVPADHWGRWVFQGAVRLYHALPTVCQQNWNDFQSRTDAKSNLQLVSSFPLPKYCWHKFKRLVGKSIDRVLLLKSKLFWRRVK